MTAPAKPRIAAAAERQKAARRDPVARQEPIVDVKAALAWFENHGEFGPQSPPGKGEIKGVFKPMHEPFHLDQPGRKQREAIRAAARKCRDRASSLSPEMERDGSELLELTNASGDERTGGIPGHSWRKSLTARPKDLLGHPLPRRADLNAEARIQAAIVEYVRTVAPKIVIWAVPNGGLRTKSEAARLKWTGILEGVLDLTLALPNGRSAYWETKTYAGKLSRAQKDLIYRLTVLGHFWAVVRSIDEARVELSRYGITTRETSPSRNQIAFAPLDRGELRT